MKLSMKLTPIYKLLSSLQHIQRQTCTIRDEQIHDKMVELRWTPLTVELYGHIASEIRESQV